DPRVRMLLAELLSDKRSADGLVLIFLEPPESAGRLPSMLADQFVRLDVAYPRAQELDDIARDEIALAAARAGLRFDIGQIKREAARLAAGLVGLNRSAARDVLRDALAPDPGDFNGAWDRLRHRKAQALRREMAMDVLETEDVEEPIGLDYLVEYLQVNRGKIRVPGPSRSRGVLLIGPPGTGKTMLARSIGRLIDLPVVAFRISSLMSSLLGETERRFSQAFATLEAMSPNVVFIDEFEKAFGDSSERDGGTMMRVTGGLLTWLSDNQNPNFIVATSNNLRRMGEIGQTMTRSERFDACFFVDVPSRSARRAMLTRWLDDRVEGAEAIAADLAEMTDKFSGADLRSLVKQGASRAEYLGTPLTIDFLKREVERKRMRALAFYEEFQDLRRWGQQHCDPAGPVDN
ncbi:MAG TPA: ATP-binding protein, partial [Thermoanaerobaculia bacterium]